MAAATTINIRLTAVQQTAKGCPQGKGREEPPWGMLAAMIKGLSGVWGKIKETCNTRAYLTEDNKDFRS